MTAFATHSVGREPRPALTPTLSRRARFNKHFEQWFPWFGGALGAGVVFVINPDSRVVYGALKGTLSSAVDAAAILAGFQGTGLALLFTLINTEPVRALRRMNQFGRLVSYFTESIAIMLLAVMTSMILLAIQGVQDGDFTEGARWIGTFAAFVAAAAGLTTIRIVFVTVKLLKSPALHKALPSL